MATTASLSAKADQIVQAIANIRKSMFAVGLLTKVEAYGSFVIERKLYKLSQLTGSLLASECDRNGNIVRTPSTVAGLTQQIEGYVDDDETPYGSNINTLVNRQQSQSVIYGYKRTVKFPGTNAPNYVFLYPDETKVYKLSDSYPQLSSKWTITLKTPKRLDVFSSGEAPIYSSVTVSFYKNGTLVSTSNYTNITPAGLPEDPVIKWLKNNLGFAFLFKKATATGKVPLVELYKKISPITDVISSAQAAVTAANAKTEKAKAYLARTLDGSLVSGLDMASNAIQFSGATSLRSNAFSGCLSLVGNLNLSGLTSIGDYAFYGCSGVTSVLFPESLVTVTNHTFDGMSQDMPITMAGRTCAQTKSMSGFPFGRSTSAVFICTDGTLYGDGTIVPNTDDDGTTTTITKTGTTVLIPAGVSNVPSSMFNQDTDLFTINNQSSVLMTVGASAFNGCSYLTSITGNLANGAIIGTSAFRNCPLVQWSPSNVGRIGDYAFNGSTNVSVSSLPYCTYIGSEAFTSAITEIHAPVCSYLGRLPFSNSLVTADFPTVEQLAAEAFYGRTALQTFSGFSSLKTIGARAFAGCTSLSGTATLSSALSIGEKAFSEANGLSIVLAQDHGSIPIGNYAFEKVSQVTLSDEIITNANPKTYFGSVVNSNISIDFRGVLNPAFVGTFSIASMTNVGAVSSSNGTEYHPGYGWSVWDQIPGLITYPSYIDRSLAKVYYLYALSRIPAIDRQSVVSQTVSAYSNVLPDPTSRRGGYIKEATVHASTLSVSEEISTTLASTFASSVVTAIANRPIQGSPITPSTGSLGFPQHPDYVKMYSYPVASPGQVSFEYLPMSPLQGSIKSTGRSFTATSAATDATLKASYFGNGIVAAYVSASFSETHLIIGKDDFSSAAYMHYDSGSKVAIPMIRSLQAPYFETLNLPDCSRVKSFSMMLQGAGTVNMPKATAIEEKAFMGAKIDTLSFGDFTLENWSAKAFFCADITKVVIPHYLTSNISTVPNYPWGLKNGTVIQCSDGNKTVTENPNAPVWEVGSLTIPE